MPCGVHSKYVFFAPFEKNICHYVRLNSQPSEWKASTFTTRPPCYSSIHLSTHPTLPTYLPTYIPPLKLSYLYVWNLQLGEVWSPPLELLLHQLLTHSSQPLSQSYTLWLPWHLLHTPCPLHDLCSILACPNHTAPHPSHLSNLHCTSMHLTHSALFMHPMCPHWPAAYLRKDLNFQHHYLNCNWVACKFNPITYILRSINEIHIILCSMSISFHYSLCLALTQWKKSQIGHDWSPIYWN